MSDSSLTTKRAKKQALGPYGKLGQAVNELDERLGVAKGGRTFMDKIFPDHWSFMLGEIALYSFVVLLATGVFLTLYYVPLYGSRDLPRLLRTALWAARHPSLRILGGPFVRRTWRTVDASDAPLGLRHFCGCHRDAHGPRVLYRRLPQAARD